MMTWIGTPRWRHRVGRIGRFGGDGVHEAPSPIRTPVKILYWLDLWWREVGGPIASVSGLAEAMASRGHEVVVATADPRDAPGSWRSGAGGITLRTLPRGRLHSISWRGRSALRNLVIGADAIHFSGLWECSTVQLAAAARRVGRPYVVSLRGTLDDWSMAQRPVRKRLWIRGPGKGLIGGAAAIHCTSLGEVRQAERWLLGRRSVVLPNLLDLNGPLSVRRRESPKPEILLLGRLLPTKGPDLLLEALAQLPPSERPLVRLAGAGAPKYLARLHEQAIRLGVADRVVFEGHVGEARRLELLASCWAMVLPTQMENFGNALFEALAAELPVVTTDRADTAAELARSGGAMIVQRDRDAIAGAVCRILADGQTRRGMGQSGRVWVRKELDPERVAAAYESMYRSLPGVSLR
jgi:glycosyltransferase involved in cell wall biosynthesis